MSALRPRTVAAALLPGSNSCIDGVCDCLSRGPVRSVSPVTTGTGSESESTGLQGKGSYDPMDAEDFDMGKEDVAVSDLPKSRPRKRRTAVSSSSPSSSASIPYCWPAFSTNSRCSGSPNNKRRPTVEEKALHLVCLRGVGTSLQLLPLESYSGLHDARLRGASK